ncbi:hypothetical protein EJ04DRAFT_516864 [Polyplosphaeria fusca]|uniref:Uncharacterized protein n=1 Tax=Polyplosphaeria fusca TaxID=682080 RepID=A0A9P4UWL3_9PLEO|nr:hypothetical protein EJ04DRAFT_516864 [Polyplosphaeria fusca]
MPARDAAFAAWSAGSGEGVILFDQSAFGFWHKGAKTPQPCQQDHFDWSVVAGAFSTPTDVPRRPTLSASNCDKFQDRSESCMPSTVFCRT